MHLCKGTEWSSSILQEIEVVQESEIKDLLQGGQTSAATSNISSNLLPMCSVLSGRCIRFVQALMKAGVDRGLL
jgi:hypothetical protein